MKSISYEQTRDYNVEVLKGVLILCVLTGHIYPKLDHYFEWFHMPLFFLIAGFFANTRNTVGKNICLKAKRILIPYYFYYFMFSIIRILIMGINAFSFDELWRILIWGAGGKSVSGMFGVWWFPACLFVSYVFYFSLSKFSAFGVVAFLLGIFSFFLSSVYFGMKGGVKYDFPWSINVSFIAVLFMYIGNVIYRKKDNIDIFNIKFFSISVIVILSYVVYDYIGLNKIDIGMKSSLFGKSIIFLVIFPLIVLYAFMYMIQLSIMKRLFLPLREIGGASLHIMYIHIPIMIFVRERISKEGYANIIILSLSLLVGWLISVISKQNKYLRLFLG